MDQAYESLVAGQRYRVVRAFVDFDGIAHPEGETWFFAGHEFVPYHDGHNFHVRYEDGRMRYFRMAGGTGDQGRILERLRDFIASAPLN
jgi:hypothetical protein